MVLLWRDRISIYINLPAAIFLIPNLRIAVFIKIPSTYILQINYYIAIYINKPLKLSAFRIYSASSLREIA